MSWTDFPSLNNLRAFATVAETGSYSRAAAALKISHAAVSQQVKALEARLGVTLVVREGRGVKLSSQGAVLARHLTAGLATIREGVEALTGADLSRPIYIVTRPGPQRAPVRAFHQMAEASSTAFPERTKPQRIGLP